MVLDMIPLRCLRDNQEEMLSRPLDLSQGLGIMGVSSCLN